MIGGDKNVIGLVERGHKPIKFFLVIVPIDLKVEVAAIHAAECIVAVHTEGKTKVVICLIGDGGTLKCKYARVELKVQVILSALYHFHRLIEHECVRVAAFVIARGKIFSNGGGCECLLGRWSRLIGQDQVESRGRNERVCSVS